MSGFLSAFCLSLSAFAAAGGPPAAPDGPMAMAAALERMIVHGEGMILPDEDVAVALKAGTVALDEGDWPEPFWSRAGETVAVAVSPETGEYEFFDEAGEPFFSIVPAVPTTENWVAPFRRATDEPAPTDPLLHPSRVVMLWTLGESGKRKAESGNARGSSTPMNPIHSLTLAETSRALAGPSDTSEFENLAPSVSFAAETLSASFALFAASCPAAPTNLQFASISLSSVSNAIAFSAVWPPASPLPEDTLDLYEKDDLRAPFWHRVASFPATNPPAFFTLPWPALADEPVRHVHDATCTATTNLVVSPLDGVTPYTNVIWSCLSPGLRRSSVPAAFFRLGTRADSDADGLPDAYEILSFGGTNAYDSAAAFTPSGFSAEAAWLSTDAARQAARWDDSAPPSFASTNEIALFSPFVLSGATNPVVFSRSFTIDRSFGWNQFFLAPSAPGEAPLSSGAEFRWADDLGATGAVSVAEVSAAPFRLALSTNAAHVAVSLVAPSGAAALHDTFSLLRWAPSLSVGAPSATLDDGTSLFATTSDGSPSFYVDRSSRPATLAPQPQDELDALPVDFPADSEFERYHADGGMYSMTFLSGAPAGVYEVAPYMPIRTLPASVLRAAGRARSPSAPPAPTPGGYFAIVDPDAYWFPNHHFSSRIVGLGGGCDLHSSWPLDAACLRDAFDRDADGTCLDPCRIETSLGIENASGVDDATLDALAAAFDWSFGSGANPTPVTLRLGGSTVWEGSALHATDDLDSESDLSRVLDDDDACGPCGGGCDGGDCDALEGDAFGSFAFRIPLGVPRRGQVSGFAYFSLDRPADLDPALFAVTTRTDSAVSDVTATASGSSEVRIIVCADPRGRSLEIRPFETNGCAGVSVVVRETSTGSPLHTWLLCRESASTIRATMLTPSGIPRRDARWTWTGGEDWTRTDLSDNSSETLVRTGSFDDPDAPEIVEERTIRDDRGTVLSRVRTTTRRIGEGKSAVPREVLREEETVDDEWKTREAEYWDDGGATLRHGRVRFVWGTDTAWSWTDYDELGRLVVRIDQRDGSAHGGLRYWTGPYDPESGVPCDDCFVTVYDYTPLAGDAADARDGGVPRTVSRYVGSGAAPTLISRSWTTVTRG
ncbi:MAG: hypothetical protein IJ783_04320, partial [Kiritimatiellae bacterium]|nr:hypothetical protein [Kiritimatiellia bacterium]